MSTGESYYRFESADGCLIITLLPVLNDKQWADIEKVGTEIVERLSAAPSPRFIVDLTPLSYMGMPWSPSSCVCTKRSTGATDKWSS